MIKALFFDLDGTLLDNKKQIPLSAIDALKKCKKNDIKIFISTARSPMLEKQLGIDISILSMFDGGIYCNGAVVKSEKVTSYKYINASIVKNILDTVSEYDDVHFALHLRNDYHSFNHYLPDEMLMPWGLERNEIVPLSSEIYSSVAKILIYKDYLVGSSKILPEQLYRDITDVSTDKAKIYYQDSGKTIQIAAKNISKLSAIKEVAAAYNFDPDEIAVFGDDTNDMEMLSHFTNSVAMGNAIAEVKNTAKFSTLSNDDGGIAYALEKILKII